MKIIRANLNHCDELATLFDAYRVFYREQSDIEAARQYIHQRLIMFDAVIFIAKNKDGKIVAFTQFYPSLCSLEMRPIWILYDLFVHPDARRNGVGRLLLEQAKQFGIEQGAARLELSTENTNTPAQSLYENIGWKRDEKFFSYSLDLP